MNGRQIRSNFGTTKYCATYLRNAPCSNPDCLYLHELGDEDDRFTKEEIQQRSLLAPPIPPGAVTVTGAGGPSGTGKRCTSPVLPPPVYESPGSNGASAGGGGAAARGVSQQVQQAAAGTASVQRGGARGAKPPGQVRSSGGCLGASLEGSLSRFCKRAELASAHGVLLVGVVVVLRVFYCVGSRQPFPRHGGFALFYAWLLYSTAGSSTLYMLLSAVSP